MEKTFMIIKPHAIKYRAEILLRLIDDGYHILDTKFFNFTDDLLEKFYACHVDKSFFISLKNYMKSGQCFAIVLKKDKAVKDLRELVGPTNPKDCRLNQLRSIYGINIDYNGLHATDKKSNVRGEIDLIFGVAK